MSVTKLSTQVPLPQVASTFMFLDDYDLTLSLPDYISARNILENDIVWSNDFNRNAAYLDILAQYGGGSIGIVHGLVISAGTGLHCNVSAGGGIALGVKQLKSSSSVVVAASVDNFIWLKNDGTLEAVNSSITPPSGGPHIFLGIATTDGTHVTSVDFSGVGYLRGGMLYREVADLGEPADTPPSVILLTKTLGGHYLWTGSVYQLVVSPSATIVAVTADKTETDSDTNTIVTNEGASSKPTITLISAKAGVERTFIVQDSDGLRIQANTGDTIRWADRVTASGGYFESMQIGSMLKLVAINATEWIVKELVGNWGNGSFTISMSSTNIST